MSIDAALFYHLSHDTGVKAIIGNRAYPAGEVPSSADYEYLVVQRMSNRHVRHMTAGSGIAAPRYQIVSWGRSHLNVQTLAEAVRECLDNYVGTMGSGASLTTVYGSFLETDAAEFVTPSDGGEKGFWAVSQEFTIWHSETVTP